jgi:hypothetical protein
MTGSVDLVITLRWLRSTDGFEVTLLYNAPPERGQPPNVYHGAAPV